MTCYLFHSSNIKKCCPLHPKPKVFWADCWHPSTTSKKTTTVLLNWIPLHTQMEPKRVDPHSLDGRNAMGEDGSFGQDITAVDETGRSSQAFLPLPFDAGFGVTSFKGAYHFPLYIDKRAKKQCKCQCTLSNREYPLRYDDTWNTFTVQAQLGSRLRVHTEGHFKFLHLAWKVHRNQDHHTITAFKILVITKAVFFFWLHLCFCFCCQKMTNKPKEHSLGIWNLRKVECIWNDYCRCLHYAQNPRFQFDF